MSRFVPLFCVTLIACRELPDKIDPPPPVSVDAGTRFDAATPTIAAIDAVTDPTSAIVTANSPRSVFVHLFEWRWPDVAEECERVLGPRGFKAVQVSPPQEHAVFDSHTWWQRYQPVSYQIISRSGDRVEFADMVARCRAAGVEVYVDAVLNHMSFQSSGVGIGGTAFSKYDYPGLYEDRHFHPCRRPIGDWNSAQEVQTCELATLPDLVTSDAYVRDQLGGFLADLTSLGVTGFRLDAAKHMAVDDIMAILTIAGGAPFVFQEVVSLDGAGPLAPRTFTGNGRVTEFRYGHELSQTFRTGRLADLGDVGASWGWLDSRDAVVFIDNHDTQRGHGAGDPLTFAERDLYELANAYMLAWPYGYPKVMSSYAFTGGDDGPPAEANGVTSTAIEVATGACSPGWICEHRWPAITNMIAFRNSTFGNDFISNWWTNGNDQVAFTVGGQGFMAINREEFTRVTRTYETGLRPGMYCDAFTGGLDASRCTGRRFSVAPDGTAALSIGPMDAIALHTGAMVVTSSVATTGWDGPMAGLGAHYDTDASHVSFAVFSENASAIQVDVFAQPRNAAPVWSGDMRRDTNGDWRAVTDVATLRAAGASDTIYYGYRAWGPNWPKAGFVSDVDHRGNRFNPNKLLTDPYAREVSHDPGDQRPFATGPEFRDIDNTADAPKSIVLSRAEASHTVSPAVARPFKDSIIYEVHVRGLTNNDLAVPEALRGTYAGAATKAAYLRDLGITAIELLPVHETVNDQNDSTPDASGDNYWGYASTSFFALDRRYAADKSPGGPTRELKAMVEAFHAEGIEVFVDVVYNHTAETGTWDGAGQVASLLSWRGLDNASYYELARRDGAHYMNSNGVGPNLDMTHPRTRKMVVDSLAYMANDLGIDGFRFDLAAVLGNTCAAGCFEFSSGSSLLAEIRQALPDVDLIAEPWGIGPGTYRIGQIGAGWAEWNGIFRDTIRRDQNEEGRTDVTPRALMDVLSGSPQLFADDGRKPWHSINYIASHDGFALRDVYICNTKYNTQPWPYGPSSGGDDQNHSWDQGGDVGRQRQAARTGLALVMLSAGVPMINGGDELYRTQYCNNNMFNLDSPANWLDWAAADAEFETFARRVIGFRNSQDGLRPSEYFASGLTFYTDQGAPVRAEYLDNPSNHFLGFSVASPTAIYVAYNGWANPIHATLPPGDWRLIGSTAAAYAPMGGMLAPADQIDVGRTRTIEAKSVAIFSAR